MCGLIAEAGIMPMSVAAGALTCIAVRAAPVCIVVRRVRAPRLARPSLVNRLPRREPRKGEDGRTLGLRENELQNRGMHCERAYVGGNWNNDLNCGPFYANLYNDPSNTNTNIGAALSYPMIFLMQCISLLNAVRGGSRENTPPFLTAW